MARAKRKPVSQLTSGEVRQMLNNLAPEAIDILQSLLADDKVENRIKLEAAKFILSQVLDDPATINTGDNLIKLAQILKE
jgi:hypothetical protein